MFESLVLECLCSLKSLKPMAGFEPATYRLRIDCSTTEPHRHRQSISIPASAFMVDPNSKNRSGKRFTPEEYAWLKAEAAAPYRGLRKFVYVAFGASGFIGGVIFLAQLIAGRDIAAALPNFALQVGVVALMIFLYRLEKS